MAKLKGSKSVAFIDIIKLLSIEQYQIYNK